jgi:hypothetical protein
LILLIGRTIFLDQLKAGDNVFVLPFSGGRTMKPGIFDGIESKKRQKKAIASRTQLTKTSTTWYPEETKWRIKPYSSQDIDKRKKIGCRNWRKNSKRLWA